MLNLHYRPSGNVNHALKTAPLRDPTESSSCCHTPACRASWGSSGQRSGFYSYLKESFMSTFWGAQKRVIRNNLARIMDWDHTLFTYAIKHNYRGGTAINSAVLETRPIPTVLYYCRTMIHCPSWRAPPWLMFLGDGTSCPLQAVLAMWLLTNAMWREVVGPQWAEALKGRVWFCNSLFPLLAGSCSFTSSLDPCGVDRLDIHSITSADRRQGESWNLPNPHCRSPGRLLTGQNLAKPTTNGAPR